MLIDRRRLVAGAVAWPLLSRSDFASAAGTFEHFDESAAHKSDEGLSQAQASSWLEVNTEAFHDNVRNILSIISKETRLCAVLKADAYGNGIDIILPEVIAAGINDVGIISNDEAQSCRSMGYHGRIIRLRPASLAEQIAAAGLNITELVGSMDGARAVSSVARSLNRRLDVHLAIDAGGMSREGLCIDNDRGLSAAAEILRDTNLRVSGMMTHFPVETAADAHRVLRAFLHQSDELLRLGNLDRKTVTLHTANSAATYNLPAAHLDMVRVGGALYGDLLPARGLTKTISLRSRIIATNTYPALSTVGYDRTFTTTRESRLALVPVGYSNGYSRSLSNRGQIICKGRLFPVLGRVSMNSLVIDITGAEDVVAGDKVTLFGRDEDLEITQEQIESVSGTIYAELATIWGRTNSRYRVGSRNGAK